MTHTLKISGEPVIPGLALPEAFQAVDEKIESTVQLCKMNGSMDGQVLGMVTICEELQRLLKLAFIENGMLATRIEILARYHGDTVKKLENKLATAETEHRVTRKQIKRLRKRLTAYETLNKRKTKEWWAVNISSSDYDSLAVLSRTGGTPDLEFMLRVNQLMIDFVADETKMELFLPPMGNEERAEISKLASLYKLRCRYGRSTQVAPSTLIKARQTCIPVPGEVDAVLNNFTKTHKRYGGPGSPGERQEKGSPNKDSLKQLDPTGVEPTSPDLPPSMLTPISNTTVPVIELGTASGKTPGHSPPGSTLATPTDPGAQKHLPPQPPSKAWGAPDLPPERTTMPENPVPPLGSSHATTAVAAATTASSKSETSARTTVSDRLLPAVLSSSIAQHRSPSYKTPPPLIIAPSASYAGYPLSVQKPSSSMFVSSHHRILPQPTVVASPLKMLPSVVSHERQPHFLPPPTTTKRLRLTRNSRGNSADHEEHGKSGD